MMNGLALCAGIGGLELGLSLAIPDYKTVCYAEREAYPAAVLVTRMQEGILPRAPIWDDIKTFRGKSWRGKVDLISAGFPCPPVSLAGKRKGTKDERWLWPEVIRIVREVKPEWIFLENVRGLLTVQSGDAFAGILRDLAESGYDAEWMLLSAAELGAPHRRERIFILAHAVDRRDPTSRQSSSEGSCEKERCTQSGMCGKELAHSHEFHDNPAGHGTGEVQRERQAPAEIQRCPVAHSRQLDERGLQSYTDEGREEEAPIIDAGKGLADANGSGGRPGMQGLEDGQGERRGGPAGGGTGMAHPSDQRLEDVKEEQAGKSDAGRNGRPVVDSDRRGCGREEIHLRQGEQGQSAPILNGAGLDDAEKQRLEGPLPAGADPYEQLPFPPGPEDTDAWKRVLELHPELAPALESPVRGVAHGPSTWADKLRALGNAVVPVVAAKAFITLRRRFSQ